MVLALVKKKAKDVPTLVNSFDGLRLPTRILDQRKAVAEVGAAGAGQDWQGWHLDGADQEWQGWRGGDVRSTPWTQITDTHFHSPLK